MARSTTRPMKPGYFLLASLGALGVVFGDIGTSPLYAFREAFHAQHGVPPTPANVLGILSLIFWALILIVTLKYLVFVLRADNQGEGGILALLALVHPEQKRAGMPRTRSGAVFVGLGLLGAALLYGEGMITPAISVLSAVEGLELAQPHFHPYVIPATVVLLLGLFLLQKRGAGLIGRLFGPVTLVWFLTLAVLGIVNVSRDLGVLAAVNPLAGIRFLLEHRAQGFFTLGAVFLAVTGTEALYADMGHFGRGPIRFTWLTLVLPSLVLNYFGQGALVLANPVAVDNPFYRLIPEWGLLPLIALATAATIIASQAMISGAFSITMQAVQLGYAPRLTIRHTSALEIGQVYVPFVNYALMVASILLVLTFRSSSGLAAMYGIGVISTMLITTTLFTVVARRVFGWRRITVALLAIVLFAVEIAFFGANIVKFPQGGYVPVLVGALLLLTMLTWRDGRRILGERLRERSKPLGEFLSDIPKRGYARVRGNAIYMTGNAKYAPPALVKNLDHNRTLHFQVALLSIVTEDVPHVPRVERLKVEALKHGFYRVVARYGFMDQPNAPGVLRAMQEQGLDFKLEETTFFLGRERLISTKRPAMAPWREKLFSFLAHNSQPATSYFQIPPDRVIEVGSQVEI